MQTGCSKVPLLTRTVTVNSRWVPDPPDNSTLEGHQPKANRRSTDGKNGDHPMKDNDPPQTTANCEQITTAWPPQVIAGESFHTTDAWMLMMQVFQYSLSVDWCNNDSLSPKNTSLFC
ncbi:hypothetical protein CRENBAI_011705 [Crenichthys baileyi]|uniref:Uncharacterized protein n=1 Tax=Crenichthys baileyi TaxID=28760 RepID=A0AAV9QTB5_9TELE